MTEYDKTKWIAENSYKSQLLGSSILPMRPDIGFFVSVYGLDIPEDMFKEEYKTIVSAYFSVIKKIKELDKEKNETKKT